MTTEQLFRLFGGRGIVMAVTGATRQSVNHWYANGVPFKYWPVLREAALSGGIMGVTDTALASTRPSGRRKRRRRRNGP